MRYEDLGPQLWAALQALTAHYGPAINHAAEAVGIPYGEWYGWLMAAHIFEPEPISAARLHVRSAYTSPAVFERHLARGVELGLLAPAGAGEYRLTQAGQVAVQHAIQAAYNAMVPLRPMPEDQLAELVGLLRRLVDASLAAPEPPGKWCLKIERHYDPGAGATAMVLMDQHMSDLNAYRDDAHLAAWQPYGISGPGWEAFTLLWRDGAQTLDQLYARLARRGFAREVYGEALASLAARGWLTQDGETYHLSEEGMAAREAAEALTDRYFYAPWACLSAAEIERLSELLTRFRTGLQEMPAQAAG